MKKFGLGKKHADDDASRSKLFGSKSRPSNSAAAPSANPYAVSHGEFSDPYAQSSPHVDPRQVASSASSSSTQLPPYQSGSSASGRPDRYKSSSSSNGGYAQGGYGGQNGYGSQSGYSNQSGYGDHSSYGNDRYENPAPAARSTPGGYGGLGRSNSHETMSTDAGRNQLFGNAPQRYQEQQQTGQLPPEQGYSDGYGEGTDGHQGNGYGQQGNRQLTAEEQEEEDVQAAKDQIRAIKQQDVSSTRNALRIAQQAEETGRATLERLGQQGERLHNTEANLDASSRENRMAREKASQLETLNRSMFAVHVNNPFTKGQRERDREAKLMETHHSERQQQADSRSSAFASLARQRDMDRELGVPQAAPPKKQDLAQRSKYQFEADSDDDQMEDEIDSNLVALQGATSRMNLLGRAMGSEIDSQNKNIDRIAAKAEKVDDGIVLNRSRLDRIH